MLKSRFLSLLVLVTSLWAGVLPAFANSQFGRTVAYPVPGLAAVAEGIADFNNDLYLDIVIASKGTPNNLSILLNNGDGSFRNGPTYTVGFSGITSLVIADFNKDGQLDIVSASRGDASIWVQFGNGDGTFQDPVGRSIHTDALAVADFDHDGNFDLANADNTGLLHIMFGKGDGTFPTSHAYHLASSRNSVVIVGYLNEDNFADIVVASSAGTHDPGALTVFLNNHNRTFQTGVAYDGGSNPSGVAVADVNIDGASDIIVANRGVLPDMGDVRELLGNGDGTFRSPTVIGGANVPQPVAVALADFGNDGRFDMVVTSAIAPRVTVVTGNGDGTFGGFLKLRLMSPARAVATADLDGDGFTDIVAPDICDPNTCDGSAAEVILNAN